MIMTDVAENKEEGDHEEEQSSGGPDVEEDFVTLGDLQSENDENDDDDDKGSSSSHGSHDEQGDEDDDNDDNDDDDNTSNTIYDPTRDLPPWMPHYVNRQRTNHMVALHNEMVGFCTLMEPRPEEMKQREELVTRFTTLAKKIFEDCEVQVFGSQATGLCLPTSDIDIAIQLNEGDVEPVSAAGDGGGDDTKTEGKPRVSKEQELKDMENWDAPSGTPLERLAAALREEWFDDLTYLEVIPNTRVPLVKFTHGPSSIQIDVCFNQKTGVQAAQLMHRYMDALPPLRPLTFVLKYFLAARGLNQPYSGGMGSFMLQMMIVSFLQHREREFAYNRMPVNYNLGALLLDFLELYSMDFNFITVGVSVRFDGYYFPKGATDRRPAFWQPSRPFSFAMENPFEPTMDVGAPSFRLSWIQRALEIAFKTVLSHVSEPAQQSISVLASILPPTDEMRKRMAVSRPMVDSLLSSPRGSHHTGNHATSSPPRKRQRR